jgi:queuine/archaeosine tRNA-ribosyltransferase
MRLVTLHNLSFVARLMADLRAAIAAGRLPEVAAALRGGAEPGASRTPAG